MFLLVSALQQLMYKARYNQLNVLLSQNAWNIYSSMSVGWTILFFYITLSTEITFYITSEAYFEYQNFQKYPSKAVISFSSPLMPVAFIQSVQ